MEGKRMARRMVESEREREAAGGPGSVGQN